MTEYVNIGLDKYERLKMFENDRYERDAKEFLKQFINFTTIFGNQEKQFRRVIKCQNDYVKHNIN
ncbi:hypothetical protein AF268_05450 [Listeria monocytogenes]|uniref:hypothetical protein n=1 Tax=Listeria monocytogenes TaxID=1639 RepID=UPI000E75EE74|nr:hypothetical protein [Listeria monocytogenes]EAE5878162.1 hypothetical protein [Listeria monocytogenes]PSA43540.1 hypothetical protein AF276_05400 [Listeria monocytogenes]PSA45776.1 hypothetical protein AF268_05450 [Listeria monocytogenes]